MGFRKHAARRHLCTLGTVGFDAPGLSRWVLLSLSLIDQDTFMLSGCGMRFSIKMCVLLKKNRGRLTDDDAYFSVICGVVSGVCQLG